MKFLESILKLRPQATRGGATGRVAVVHWDQETIDYMVVSPKKLQISGQDIGRVAHGQHANPIAALAEHFREQSIQVQRLIVLLARPALEQLNLTLPPASPDELPALVLAEVEQQLGESEEAPIVDYYLLAKATAEPAAENNQVMAFSLPAAELEKLKAQCKESGFRLAAVGSRDLAPLGILRRRNIAEDSLSISVHLYSSEAELAICRGAEPIYLRLIQINVDDPQRLAEQIWMETQRCLTILPAETAELPQGWFLFTTCETAWRVAQALEDRGLELQPVDPLIGWELDGKARVSDESFAPDSPPVATGSAANAGAAWEFLNGTLPIDLLSPKQPPRPPNRLIRWGVLGTAAALAVGVGAYFLLSDVQQLRTDVAGLQTELNDLKKLTGKFQEKSDQVAFVEGWLTDQVDWLSELNEVSRRLPDGQNATVRRLTASANGKTARIDLSLQVAEQENISQLESRIRSAKYTATSQRISQSPDSSEYPWQFETQITFPIEPTKPDAYVAGSPPPAEQPAAEQPAAEQPVAEQPVAEQSVASPVAVGEPANSPTIVQVAADKKSGNRSSQPRTMAADSDTSTTASQEASQ